MRVGRSAPDGTAGYDRPVQDVGYGIAMHSENSEVDVGEPSAVTGVAVAVMTLDAGSALDTKAVPPAMPAASVVTGIEPRYDLPSP
jgi:hypothetical protein